MPIAAVVALVVVWNRPLSLVLVLIVAIALIAAVFAAVHHAEVVAHRVGEPFGTLILAVAVTVIEASLIVSMMVSGGPTAAVVARDAVYAAVMIILTGIVGICLLIGGLRHHVTAFRVEGTSPVLAVLSALLISMPALSGNISVLEGATITEEAPAEQPAAEQPTEPANTTISTDNANGALIETPATNSFQADVNAATNSAAANTNAPANR